MQGHFEQQSHEWQIGANRGQGCSTFAMGQNEPKPQPDMWFFAIRGVTGAFGSVSAT
jgi:hypothetical protein